MSELLPDGASRHYVAAGRRCQDLTHPALRGESPSTDAPSRGPVDREPTDHGRARVRLGGASAQSDGLAWVGFAGDRQAATASSNLMTPIAAAMRASRARLTFP